MIDEDKVRKLLETTNLIHREIALRCQCSIPFVSKYKLVHKIKRPEGYDPYIERTNRLVEAGIVMRPKGRKRFSLKQWMINGEEGELCQP